MHHGLSNLLAAAESMGAADDADGPHLVRVHDPEVGANGDQFWGPYDGAPAAMLAAERLAADLNNHLPDDETPFVTTVHTLTAEEAS